MVTTSGESADLKEFLQFQTPETHTLTIYMLEYYCTYAVNCVIYCSAVQDEGHGVM